MMHVKIYGRAGCPFCTKAKELSQELKDKGFITSFEYIDFVEQKIPRLDVEKMIGREIKTVPVVLINDIFIGGYTDLKARFPGL